MKHGRYSKSLGKFREAYEEARRDPSLLDLRETLALLDVVLQKAVARASDGDTPEFRKKARELCEVVEASIGAEDCEEHVAKLAEYLDRGVEETRALEQLSTAAERLSRRQEKAWKIRLDAASAINARDLVAVLSRFADIVLEEVPKLDAARVIKRIDREVLGTGPAAVGLEAGHPT